MQQLLSYIRQAKDKKLADYREQLSQQRESSLQPLVEEKTRLQQTYKRVVKTVEGRKEARLDFDQQQALQFELLTKQRNLLNQVWEETTAKHWKKTSSVNKWLKKQVSQLPKQKGKISAGKSYATLQKIVPSKGPYKLVKSADLDKEHGFIFAGETQWIDGRLSTYQHELFEHHNINIHKKLFG